MTRTVSAVAVVRSLSRDGATCEAARWLALRVAAAYVVTGLVACACLAPSRVAFAEPPTPAQGRAALPTPSSTWPRAPLIEAGAELVGLPAVRAETDATGEGATVCLVDTGVDLSLPDLRDAGDGTRVRWLLDLDAPPRGVHVALEAEFGAAVYAADELDAAGRAAPGDWHGHGTAMATIALGDDARVGEDMRGPHAGAAPSASLVVVRALRRGVPGFRDEDLIAGVRFCFAVAGLGPRPTDASRTVALLGSGGHDGAHDGSSVLERALAAEVEAGHAVVVAAGNDGGRRVHAAGELNAGESQLVPFFVPAPVGTPAAHSLAVVVYVAPAASTRVALLAPDGTRTALVAAGEETCADHSGGRLCVDARATSGTTSRRIYALVAGGGDVPVELSGGRYTLELVGQGRFDAWIAGTDLGVALGRAEFVGDSADDRRSVAIPASAPGVLAVGAATSRPPLATADSADASCLGCPLPRSARGPNRLGAAKPDLVAPGGYVLVPLSADVALGDAQNLFAGLAPARVTLVAADGRVALSGSSFAAPWVAGALALAYSVSPADVPRDADLLRATARPADGAAYTPGAGAGLLDVDTFLAARARTQGPASAARSIYALTARDGQLVVRLLDDAGWPARGELSLYDHDALVACVHADAGWAVLAPESPFTPQHRLRLDGRLLGPVVPTPPGCTLTHPGAHPGFPLLTSALLAALLLLRRRPPQGRS